MIKKKNVIRKDGRGNVYFQYELLTIYALSWELKNFQMSLPSLSAGEEYQDYTNPLCQQQVRWSWHIWGQAEVCFSHLVALLFTEENERRYKTKFGEYRKKIIIKPGLGPLLSAPWIVVEKNLSIVFHFTDIWILDSITGRKQGQILLGWKKYTWQSGPVLGRWPLNLCCKPRFFVKNKCYVTSDTKTTGINRDCSGQA